MAISYYFISRSGGKLPGEEIPQIRFGLPGPASIAVGPSLSATALRRAQELQGKFRPAIEAGKEVLFVAPDPCGFDTLCAMFLVRRALEGRPLRDRLAMLLAFYANSERLGLPISCPLAERLSSIALAAKRRGRPLEADGFSRMFEDAVRRMDERGLNPAFDAVLAGVEEWRPEQELLRRDEVEYRKDRERAVRELALWDSNGPPRVEEALIIHQPRSLLFARWAWDDTSASTEGRGFPLVLIRSGSRQGIAVAPGAGLPQAIQRLAQLLAGTDPEGGWMLIGRDGADGEYGETGLWSLEGSRLDSTALGELLRTQWVEAVVNGPIRVCDYAAEHGRAQVDG
ncbi:MAG: hypothetical protein SFV51_20600, partial [Bryobacteraceae bacterium]|nr:hypothetical protein [Bryobacteraceae bacterium]